MPACLIVGGPFHGEIRHVALYARIEIAEGNLKATYVPCSMWSKRGSEVMLRCLVDIDVAYRPTERLKLTLDSMMRNVACVEPWGLEQKLREGAA